MVYRAFLPTIEQVTQKIQLHLFENITTKKDHAIIKDLLAISG